MSLAQWDFQAFQMVNSWAAAYSFMNPLMRLLSEDAEYLFYAGVIVYWFTRVFHNRRMVFEALSAAVVAMGISGLIGLSFYRDRPFVTHHVLQMIPHAANASFPSDHAIGAFVIASSIWLFRKRDGCVWLLLAALISFSRVWNGVHYPTDVIAGAALGMVSAVAVHTLFTRSSFFQRWLGNIIYYYEKLENKIWVKP